jgi:glycine/D-amino acid oxidase-like deaminating enzyme
MKWAWSFWEQDCIKAKYDLIIVGGGFSGLSSANFIKQSRPDWKILVIDKAQLQRAASTRNAGFGCISNLSELIEDAEKFGWDDTLQLIEWRWKGLRYLKQNFDLKGIDYSEPESGEVFFNKQSFPSENYLDQIDEVNRRLKDITGHNYFRLQQKWPAHIKQAGEYVSHHQEGQLHPMKLWHAWMQKCWNAGIQLIENCEMKSYHAKKEGIQVDSTWGKFETQQLLFCTNGHQFLPEQQEDVDISTNFVFVSYPLSNLKWNANIHAEAGYVYARNIQNRLLVGGGRHILDPGNQKKPGEDDRRKVWQYLREFTARHLDGIPYNWSPEIQWTGFLGVGSTKMPILKSIDNNVFMLGRLSGMGVALSSYLGQKMAKLISS